MMRGFCVLVSSTLWVRSRYIEFFHLKAMMRGVTVICHASTVSCSCSQSLLQLSHLSSERQNMWNYLFLTCLFSICVIQWMAHDPVPEWLFCACESWRDLRMWDVSDPLWDSSCSSRWQRQYVYGLAFGLAFSWCWEIWEMWVLSDKGRMETLWLVNPRTQEPTWSNHKSQRHPVIRSLLSVLHPLHISAWFGCNRSPSCSPPFPLAMAGLQPSPPAPQRSP